MFVLLCITFCPFQLCNHLEEEEKSGCSAIFVLQMYFYNKCSVTLPTGAWVGQRCLIVVFPSPTHLLFEYETVNSYIKQTIYSSY